MAGQRRVLVVGGSGVFGRLFARELARSQEFRLVIAGRAGSAAADAARDVGAGAEALALDLRDLRAVRAAAVGAFAVVCLAGPFQSLDRAAPAAVVEAGAHWLDIADDPVWVDGLLTSDELRRRCRESGLTVIPGLSSTPAVSGILVRLTRRALPAGSRAAITLFIGNRNAKGAGAIASAIAARPAGSSANADLPFGRRGALPFLSPDAVLLGRELGIAAEFRVAFESRAAALFIRLARTLPLAAEAKQRLAGVLSDLSVPLSRFGSDAGGIDVALRAPDGESAHARASGHGQRIAILPAVVVLQELARESRPGDCVTPAEALPLDRWIAALEAEGIHLDHPVRARSTA